LRDGDLIESGRAEELATIVERDKAFVEEMIVLGQQKQTIIAISSLRIRALTPRLDVRSSKQVR
jgi:hypothetical protein